VAAKVVIVGGGFGGLAAARGLAGADAAVTLVDRHNYHLFQPLLYQVATAVLSPGDIASPIRWILRRQRNTRVLLATTTSVDVARRLVILDSGELPYEYLVLATGVRHAYFGHDEWSETAPGLKTLDDALEIRRRVLLAFERAERETDATRRQRLLTFVVVGGGPTGVELAGALAEARAAMRGDFRAIDTGMVRILLVEAGPAILPTFHVSLSAAAERSLQRLGVEARKGQPVTAIEPGAVRVGDDIVHAETVIWAAGVAASELGRTLGVPLDRAGRVIVERDLSVPGHPEVLVIGDLSAAKDDAGRPFPGLAAVAMQQGAHAAASIRNRIAGATPAPFRYRDYGTMATVGRNAGVAEIGRLRLSGWIGWMAWLFIHLLKLIGFRNRASVLLQWVWAYFTYQRSVRLITGEKT
jgi:NADH dehydrogenase